MIVTSHIGLHTWPDLRQAYFDVLSCRDFEVPMLVSLANDAFSPGQTIVRELQREPLGKVEISTTGAFLPGKWQ